MLSSDSRGVKFPDTAKSVKTDQLQSTEFKCMYQFETMFLAQAAVVIVGQISSQNLQQFDFTSYYVRPSLCFHGTYVIWFSLDLLINQTKNDLYEHFQYNKTAQLGWKFRWWWCSNNQMPQTSSFVSMVILLPWCEATFAHPNFLNTKGTRTAKEMRMRMALDTQMA